MNCAFARNLGILTPSEQDTLFRSRVAVPGLGGVGGLHCTTLARLGVGAFRIADPDSFELANFNRQSGACMRHLGQDKLSAMREEILQINPYAAISTFPEGLTSSNLDAFLAGVDVVVDGLDFFAFAMRRSLFKRAQKRGIPVVTAAPLGFTSSVLIFTAESMGFDDYFGISDAMTERECMLRFAVGLAPAGLHLGQMDSSRVSLDLRQGPSLGIACLLCATLAATETVRLITGRSGLRPAPWSFQVDPLGGRSRWSRPRGGNASPSQRVKLWYVRNIVLGGDAGMVRKPPAAPGHAPGAESPTPGQLRWLVQAALQAPSGDNCQPWGFTTAEGAVEIHLKPDVDRSFFNIRQLASAIACGASVQNIVSAAPAIGFYAHPELMPDGASPDRVARVRLSAGSAFPDPLGDAVWTRCTNRRMYARKRIDAFSREQLESAANPAMFLTLQEPERIRKLAGLLYLADRIRVERRDLHEHFTGMTRFDPPDGSGHDDGLPLKNLYAGAAGEVFLRLTRPWAAMRMANALGMGRLVALHSKLCMNSSPMAGLVCVEAPTRESFLRGGMAVERVWLTATRLGLAMQPMTAITLFWLRWKLEGPGAFSPVHQRLLEGIWPKFRELFPQLGDSCWPVMLLRAGYAKPIRYWTPRKLLDIKI